MECINGEWIMLGTAPDAPDRLHNVTELTETVSRIGFLPLFGNSVPGFSAEEMTCSADWWCGNEEIDPWEWRRTALYGGKLAYGKLFNKKAAFISLDWLPYFANWRRDGYDFDSRVDEGLAPAREKKIMDVLEREPVVFSYVLKELAGFGKGGEKNFEGIVTGLQMQGYVTVAEYRQKTNTRGKDYGWHIARLSTPEHLYGADFVRSAYKEEPEFSRSRFYSRVKECFTNASDKQIQALLK